MIDLSSDRRRSGRFSKSLKAVCQVHGNTFEASTLDISSKGMGLLVSAGMPPADQFQVRCFLPDGTTGLLEVAECERHIVREGQNTFLRLGVVFTAESTQNISFFQQLARLSSEAPADPSSEVQLGGMDAEPNAERRPRI